MIGKLLLWVRRNSRRAVALAVAPGLAVLGVDAYIEHYAGRSGEDPLQRVPVAYGAAAFLLLAIVCLPRSRAVFTWGARVVGAAGVFVGLWGAYLHFQLFLKDLDGKWTWNTVEGALDVAPPLFAPMAFAMLGGLVIALTSSRLSLRIKLGTPARPLAAPAPLAAVAAAPAEERKASQG